MRYDVDTDSYPRDADGHLQLVDVDEPGEAIGMIYDIPDIMAGRFEGYTSPEATEKKILRNVFADGDAWWASGDMLRCETQTGSDGIEPPLPQSLMFLQHYLRDEPTFVVSGERLLWQWSRG